MNRCRTNIVACTRWMVRLIVLAVLLPCTAGAQVPGVTGTLIITNKAPSTASIVDLATGRVLAALPTGNGPHEVAVSDDGRVAVVSDYGAQQGGHTLTVIDVPGLRVVRTIDLGQYLRPHGITFLAADSLVLVTSEVTGNVLVVNVQAGEVRRVIPTEQNTSHMLALVRDHTRIYTGNIRSNTVSELDLPAGRFVKSFPVPAQPEAINVTPDGSEVWVGSNTEGKVSVLDPRTGTVTTAQDSFGFPYRIRFTPDLRTVLLPDARREELRFVDRASRRELARLSLTGGGPQGIILSPDGRYAFLSLSAQDRIAIIDIAARKVAGYVPANNTPDGVAYTQLVVTHR